MVQGLLPAGVSEAAAARGAVHALPHALTIDLEDYFMVSAAEAKISKRDWPSLESRLARNTEKVLHLLDHFGAKATFFTVGWVADHYPDLVRRVARAGHEIACHGYHHRLIYEQKPEEFRDDLRRAKGALERACGHDVIGYRAPSFSMTPETEWAFDILREEGFSYDASVLPAAHARGGFAGERRFPYRRRGLVEFPMSTMKLAGRTVPYSGGGYFRLFPYRLIKKGIEANLREGQLTIVYLHPWEFDPDQPRLPLAGANRFKHYVNLEKTEAKFRRLLSEYRFSTVQALLRGPLGLMAAL